MRYVTVFVAGIAAGYTLHIKKDQTIESVASSVVGFLDKRSEGLRSRISVNVG
jgi:hypothetical protein